jgi:hypothetical protein
MTGPATGMPPGSWPCGWLGAATWTGPSRYCAPPPTPATGQQLGNLLAGIIRDNDALSLITRCVSYGNSTCGGT